MTRVRLGWLVALLLSCVASTAFGQGINDVPTPDELQSSAAELTITSPLEGAAVEVPFTVTGNAPAGARLGLVLDGELERVFVVDIRGVYIVPVSRAAKGPITIYLLGADGERVSTVTRNVAWSGVAPDRPVDPVDSGAAAPNAGIDPFSEPSTPAPSADGETAETAPKKGLPKVSDLDAAYARGEELPSLRLEDSESDAVVVQSEETLSPPVQLKNPPPRGVRALGEAGLGLAVAGGAGFAGGALGFGIGLATGDFFALIFATVVGGGVGIVVGLPIGVKLAGDLMDGNGKWWAVIAGEGIGLLTGLALSVGLGNSGAGGIAALSLIAMPVAGAVIGYELTSDRSASRAKMTLSPSVGTTEDGNLAFGFKLQF